MSYANRSLIRTMTVVGILLCVSSAPYEAAAKKPADEFVDQWSYEDTNVFDAWDITTGSDDVVVAVIDNGFDTFHPDLYDNAWRNEDEIEGNGVDDDGNGYIDDVWGWDFSIDAEVYEQLRNGTSNGTDIIGDNDPRPSVFISSEFSENIHHASVVAGIIGAVGGNQRDVAGINWKVKLMNLRVVDYTDSGEVGVLIRAIRYAVENGADIINLSLVSLTRDEPLREVIRYAYDQGVLVVAAAGNNATNLDVTPGDPACADAESDEEFVLGVSAIDEAHRIFRFSNIGRTCIDITAPGTNIISTQRYAPRYGFTESYGGGWNGTSFAVPFVSGAAALVKSIQPFWGPAELFTALTKTVHRTPPDDPVEYETLFGYGLLQIDKAVEYAQSMRNVVRSLNRVLLVEKQTGTTWHADPLPKDGQIITEKLSVLSGIDSITAFGDGFVTVSPRGGEKRRIIVYTKNWQIASQFDVTAFGPLGVLVGDVDEADGEEIILYPEYADTWLYSVRTSNGQELSRARDAGGHQGLALALWPTGENLADIILMYRRVGEETRVHRVIRGEREELFSVAFVGSRGTLGAGDLDNDGTVEIVIGAAAKETPFLAYVTPDGAILRKVYAYSGYDAGFDVIVGDMDADGREDVMTVPKTGAMPIRIWNDQARKIGQWVNVSVDTPWRLQLVPLNE